MELMYRGVVIAGFAVLAATLAALFFIRRKKKNAFSIGLRAANTGKIRNSSFYKKLERRYKVFFSILVAGIVGSIAAAVILTARPYMTDDVVNGVRKRDIILCLDVSYSLYDLNYEITDYLKEVVKGLEGDRIGVNIFNTSSVTYVPLTDDYDYVVQKLEELSDYFVLQKEYMESFSGRTLASLTDEEYDRYEEISLQLDYYDAGTLYNNMSRGSSLIGEGLGTALYSFPYLGESDRTRVIIMCTDNELNAMMSQIMNLDEAAAACAKNDVTVFGIFPSEEVFYRPEEFSYSSCLNGFKKAVESTGGKFYVRTADNSVSEIVRDIQKQEAMLVKVIMTRQMIDMPKDAFVALIICLAAAVSAGLVLQK